MQSNSIINHWSVHMRAAMRHLPGRDDHHYPTLDRNILSYSLFVPSHQNVSPCCLIRPKLAKNDHDLFIVLRCRMCLWCYSDFLTDFFRYGLFLYTCKTLCSNANSLACKDLIGRFTIIFEFPTSPYTRVNVLPCLWHYVGCCGIEKKPISIYQKNTDIIDISRYFFTLYKIA